MNVYLSFRQTFVFCGVPTVCVLRDEIGYSTNCICISVAGIYFCCSDLFEFVNECSSKTFEGGLFCCFSCMCCAPCAPCVSESTLFGWTERYVIIGEFEESRFRTIKKIQLNGWVVLAGKWTSNTLPSSCHTRSEIRNHLYFIRFIYNYRRVCVHGKTSDGKLHDHFPHFRRHKLNFFRDDIVRRRRPKKCMHNVLCHEYVGYLLFYSFEFTSLWALYVCVCVRARAHMNFNWILIYVVLCGIF